MANAGLAAPSRTLTFEERVAGLTAIERVYYSHQIGAKRTFEEAVPREVLERRVRTTLLQSAALDELWKTPVTHAMLRAELTRIARDTRFRDRLLEIYHALGDDPLLVLECFARPTLVDRLARNFFAYDRRIHGPSQEEAERLRTRSAQAHGGEAELPSATRIVEFERSELPPGGEAADEAPAWLPDGTVRTLRLTPVEFARVRSMLPQVAGDVGPLEEERERFVVRSLLEASEGRLRVAVLAVPKVGWDPWWSKATPALESALAAPDGRFLTGPVPLDSSDMAGADEGLPLPPAETSGGESTCAPDDSWENGILDDSPDPRFDHTAIWTGTHMVVWGGYNYTSYLANGAVYDPLTDSWRLTSSVNAPTPRTHHSAVWDGSEMIVWGGFDPVSYLRNDGARYDPVGDRWLPVSTLSAPTPRTSHTAVWTGESMIVWGGSGTSSYLATGGRYDPVTDTWLPTTLLNTPQARTAHTAVWTGTRMLVWGGGMASAINSGGSYDPAADSWSPMTLAGAPTARTGHTAVWTGDRMAIWGGSADSSGSSHLKTGALFDPATGTWAPMNSTDAPSPRSYPSAVWTGSRVVVWGGTADPFQRGLDSGGRYDPLSDTWSPTSTINAAPPSNRHTAVWTGERMIVWGGLGFGAHAGGGRYDPELDTWTPTSHGSGPSARSGHSAVWTGGVMVVWGGFGDLDVLRTGGRYDPLTDSWSPAETEGAPPATTGHTAVWTGNRMIVWGGYGEDDRVATGARYDPLGDSWESLASDGVPSARSGHTAVWSGQVMTVWGGTLSGNDTLGSGGRYDPVADAWQPVSTVAAPLARTDHTAVWAGGSMIVWGGRDDRFNAFNTGARYDPEQDRWEPTATLGAPVARLSHSAVSTGSRMIVWGGTGYAASGGRYNPATDTWAATPLENAPQGRARHAAVWTGTQMVVWGGDEPYPKLGSGGRYDPARNVWIPTALYGAPSARTGHTAVWSGDFMIVWGGSQAARLASGGRYVVRPRADRDGDGYIACEVDCDDANSAIHPGAAEVCDGVDDDCDGFVDEGGDALCDDGDVCDGPETCAGLDGCREGGALSCDDGNGCTTDSCDPIAGCTALANTDPCSDGDACTGGDRCQDGACTSGPALSCDDGIACTVDSCSSVSGCDSQPTLACGSPASLGYYRRLCQARTGSDGLTQQDADCANDWESLAGVDSVEDLCERLHSNPSNDKCLQAEAQFAALALNLCRGRAFVGQGVVSLCGSHLTVGEAAADADARLSDPGRTRASCTIAQCEAAEVNFGVATFVNTLGVDLTPSGDIALTWQPQASNARSTAPSAYHVWRASQDDRRFILVGWLDGAEAVGWIDLDAPHGAGYLLTFVIP